MQFLMVVLIFVVSLLTLVLFGLLSAFLAMSKKGKSTTGFQFRKSDIEELLSSGHPLAAREAAIEWKRKEPMNTSAYMLLAKAEFRLGEYVQARKILEELVDFAPEFEFSSRSYLARINEKLKNSRPRAVD